MKFTYPMHLKYVGTSLQDVNNKHQSTCESDYANFSLKSKLGYQYENGWHSLDHSFFVVFAFNGL